ncbi:hypothetical protein MYCTH_87980 [Thermothelomyces thermophilus ATCC 42464]|uniref:Uncharacterized protein n=1 Tax=Thermothelomyces thermophilus (strain ATCC 42464 / BCRC 31852 / DSM 1799) TaxID=573729 RepID=G2QEM7_THET4|nr:uncharacterized protein MYCTH_87980 [Thermothelomyces thermophilus ATCC 42464]AEO57810.1 hypothetical protein MYCTH_87980 [Thermothelomyces thermophilus ATCC 42464]
MAGVLRDKPRFSRGLELLPLATTRVGLSESHRTVLLALAHCDPSTGLGSLAGCETLSPLRLSLPKPHTFALLVLGV